MCFWSYFVRFLVTGKSQCIVLVESLCRTELTSEISVFELKKFIHISASDLQQWSSLFKPHRKSIPARMTKLLTLHYSSGKIEEQLPKISVSQQSADRRWTKHRKHNENTTETHRKHGLLQFCESLKRFTRINKTLPISAERNVSVRCYTSSSHKWQSI